MWWDLIFIGPEYRICFLLPFWHVNFEVVPRFFENLCTPEIVCLGGGLLCNVCGCQSFRGTCCLHQNPIDPEDEQQVAQKYWYLQDKVLQLDDHSLMNSSPFRSV